MERRIVLRGLLAGLPLACGAARAQTAAPPAQDLSAAARAHGRDTAAAGAQSLVVSRIALAKLRHPMTRQFAGFEVAEQEAVADVLRGRLAPGAGPSGTTTDADAEAALGDDGRAAAARFRDMSAGPELEKSYVQAQLEGHNGLLSIQDRYLQLADDPFETAVAKLVRGRVQEHLVLLGDIARHLG